MMKSFRLLLLLPLFLMGCADDDQADANLLLTSAPFDVPAGLSTILTSNIPVEFTHLLDLKLTTENKTREDIDRIEIQETYFQSRDGNSFSFLDKAALKAVSPEVEVAFNDFLGSNNAGSKVSLIPGLVNMKDYFDDDKITLIVALNPKSTNSVTISTELIVNLGVYYK